MNNRLISLDPHQHTLVRNEIIGKMTAHLKMSVDLLESVKEAVPPTIQMDRMRTIIARHHHKMFLYNNNQNPPGESDQQHLDELTEGLLKQLTEPG